MTKRQEHATSTYTRRVWTAAAVGAVTVLLLLALFHGIQILLVLFAGLLAALALSIPTRWLSRHTPINDRWSMLAVLLTMVLLAGTFGYWCVLRLSTEGQQLVSSLPGAIDMLRQQVADWPLLPQVIDNLRSDVTNSSGPLGNWVARATGFLTSTTGLLINLAIIVIVGLYVAAEPLTYRNGVLRLIPDTRRDQAGKLLDVISRRLSWWLMGQLVSMLAVGLLTWLGLWLLGVPTAFTLAVLAGLLELIPNFGPIISVVPAVLVATGQSPELALWVLGLYALVQLLESYAITPIVQRRAVEIPPALLIIVQVALGAWVGLIGLLVAAPLTAMVLVTVEHCWVRGWLGRGDDD